jgi:hypothetical protein
VTGDAAFYYGKTSHAVGALMASRLQSLIGKFDRSGVSGSTGRGRSQALESKVRFADHPEVALNSVCDHPAAAGIYPQSAPALGTFA